VLTIGIDCGADSVRALVVRCADGGEFGGAVVGCPCGEEGAPLDESDRRPARRQPTEILCGLGRDVKQALARRGGAARIVQRKIASRDFTSNRPRRT
jgi:L-ribulokinase